MYRLTVSAALSLELGVGGKEGRKEGRKDSELGLGQRSVLTINEVELRSMKKMRDGAQHRARPFSSVSYRTKPTYFPQFMQLSQCDEVNTCQ